MNSNTKAERPLGGRGQNPHLETDKVLREMMSMTQQEIEDDLKAMGITPCTSSADDLRKYGIPCAPEYKSTTVRSGGTLSALSKLCQLFKHSLNRVLEATMSGLATAALLGALISAPVVLYLSSNGSNDPDQHIAETNIAYEADAAETAGPTVIPSASTVPSVASSNDTVQGNGIVIRPVSAELQETGVFVIDNFDNLSDANEKFLSLESSGYRVSMEKRLIENRAVYSVRIGPFKDERSRNEARKVFPDAEEIPVFFSQ